MPFSRARIPPRIGERPFIRPSLVGLSALVVAGGASILYLFNPAQHGFYPQCYLYRTTGLLCPGCGSLRALHQLLHGHLAAACRFNALLVASLPAIAFLAARWVVCKWTGRPLGIQVRPIWLWCGLAVLLVFGILRNLPFAQLAWLAPKP